MFLFLAFSLLNWELNLLIGTWIRSGAAFSFIFFSLTPDVMWKQIKNYSSVSFVSHIDAKKTRWNCELNECLLRVCVFLYLRWIHFRWRCEYKRCRFGCGYSNDPRTTFWRIKLQRSYFERSNNQLAQCIYCSWNIRISHFYCGNRCKYLIAVFFINIDSIQSGIDQVWTSIYHENSFNCYLFLWEHFFYHFHYVNLSFRIKSSLLIKLLFFIQTSKFSLEIHHFGLML